MASERLDPNGNDLITGWTLSSYTLIDDGATYNDGDYTEVNTAATARRGLWYLTNSTFISESIISKVTQTLRSQGHVASANHSIRVGGNIYNGGAFGSGSAPPNFTTYTYDWIASPDTSVPWTKTEIDNASCGVYYPINVVYDNRLSWAKWDVYYEIPSGGYCFPDGIGIVLASLTSFVGLTRNQIPGLRRAVNLIQKKHRLYPSDDNSLWCDFQTWRWPHSINYGG